MCTNEGAHHRSVNVTGYVITSTMLKAAGIQVL